MARFDIDTPQVSPDLDSPVFQEEEVVQDDTPDVNVFSDIGLGALRGIRGMAQSTYELVDYVGEKVTGGVIDLHDFEADWDWGLGESQTWQGQMTEGVTQFLMGFIPMFGAVSAVSKAGALGKAGQVLSKSNFLRGMVAGAGADFTVFTAHEHRLSNLIKQHTELRSPILDYLESDGDEGELEGRFKNALEGAILGAGAEAVIRGLMKGVKFIKAARKVRAGVDEPEQMIPELLRRPDADELLDEDAFIGPIRELDSLDSQARNAIDDGAREVIDDEAEAVIDSAEDAAQAQKDVEDYIEVSRDNNKRSYSDEVDPEEARADAERVAKDIGTGGSTKFSTTADKFGFMEDVNALVDKEQKVKPKSETGPEHMNNARDALPDKLDREYSKQMITEDIETLTSIRNRITAFRMIASDIVGEMNKAIEEMATVGKDKTYAIISKYLDDLYEYSALESQVARQFGKGLQQTKLFRNRKSMINVSEVRSGSDAGAKAAIRGREEGMVDEVVALLTSGADTDTVLKQVLNIAEKSKGGRFEVLREVLLANLLSAPPSQFANGFGGLLTLGLDTAEKSIGALFSGNPQLAKMHIMQTIDAITTAEVWKAAGRSYKTGSPTLLGNTATTPFGEVIHRSKLTSENLFGKPAPGSKHQSFNETMDAIFNIFKLPFRGLTGTDEIFKQINARRAAMFKATIEAIEKEGIKDPAAIAKYVDDKLRSVVMAGGQLYSKEALYRQGVKIAKARGFTKRADLDRVAKAHVVKNYDKDRSAFAAYVGNEANVLSFTNDLNPDSLAGGIYQLANKHPITSLVMPFIRTPLNILVYAKDRTVFEAMNGSQLYQQLTSSDTAVKSAAIGRLSTTIAASVGMLGVMRQFNRNENMHISGGGPRDPDKRKRLEETGWQPYSIKIGDKYYSYQRLDPFATIIGIYADALDLMQEGEFNVSEDAIQRTLIITFSALQRNIINKSYLTGVEQFSAALSDTTGKKIQRWIGSTSSNFIPWSSFLRTTVGGVTGQIMDDHEVKMVRNMGDYWLRNIPVAQGRLDPKRNLLGEAQEYGAGNLFRAFMPINVREYDDSDDVMQEIARLSHGFTQVSPSYRGLIDLTNYRNSKNQSAHDRRLELMSTTRINGKSLRQSLQNVIASQEYQKHSPRSEPGLTSPRVRMLNRVLSEYRAKAFDEMLKEFPELADFKRDYDLAKDEQRRGVAIDNLIQTLNF